MTDEPSSAPAGWYPTPTGENRYWDGQKWLALLEPDAAIAEVPNAVAVAISREEADSRDAVLPDTATDVTPSRLAIKRKRAWIWVTALIVVLGLIGGGFALKSSQDAHTAADAKAAASAAAASKAAADAKRVAANVAAATAAKESVDSAERASRKLSVVEIESSVKKMAEGHANDGVINGPIVKVTCSPVGGGSTDDLTDSTTVFECFVANKDNGDGTMSGYTYNATMNWSTGSYTFGLGDA
jgi:hypothetical protein